MQSEQIIVGVVLLAANLSVQEYEMLPEEGTRAEQLAKQQKNLKQRWVTLTMLLTSTCRVTAQMLSFLKECMQARAGRQDGGPDGHQRICLRC